MSASAHNVYYVKYIQANQPSASILCLAVDKRDHVLVNATAITTMRVQLHLHSLVCHCISAGIYKLILPFLLVTANAHAVNNIVILGLFKDKAIIEIDGKRQVLSPNDTVSSNVKLISASSKAAIIEVEGRRNIYTLGTHIGSRFAQVSPKATVRIWPDQGGMYTVGGNINEFPVEFLVDTGASMIAMNQSQAKRLGLDFRVIGEQGRTATASGVATAYYLTLGKVRVGDIELWDVKAAIMEGDFPIKCLLGMSFLGRVDIVRDGQVMELRKK